MSRLDAWFELLTRNAARRNSRRSLFSRIGMTLVGASTLPLLPVARAGASQEGASGDPTSCEYWRHCAIDGFLCSCCGGSQTACPPGTQMSPVTWIGTCHNPDDGKDYVISYNDCCGRSFCGRCFCNRNEGERPMYYPFRNNDINWCMGAENQIYNCSTAIVIGVALEAQPEK
jgi:methylamine dehydrogenase light chain